MSIAKKDLLVLVADLDAEQTIQTLLLQPQKLGIRALNFKIIRHPLHDNGCYNDGHNLLRSQYHLYHKVLMIFDYHGSGAETRKDPKSPSDVEADCEQLLLENGWDEGAVRVVVLNPELEIWVWSDSPQVDEVLAWKGKQPTLRQWLEQEGFWQAEAPKPHQPKEALEKALFKVQKRHNANVFKQLAENVSFKRCSDASFLRFKETLIAWFGI